MGTRSIFTLVLLSTINLSSASFTTLTKDGYQNVVIIIQEDSTYNSNCQETLDNVKVRALAYFEYYWIDEFYRLVLLMPGTDKKHFDQFCSSIGPASLLWKRHDYRSKWVGQ